MCRVLSRSFQTFEQDSGCSQHLWALEKNLLLEEGEISVSRPSSTFICKRIYSLWLKHLCSGVFLSLLETWESHTRRELVVWWWFLTSGVVFFFPVMSQNTLEWLSATQLQKEKCAGAPSEAGGDPWPQSDALPSVWNGIFQMGPVCSISLCWWCSSSSPGGNSSQFYSLHLC